MLVEYYSTNITGRTTIKMTLRRHYLSELNSIYSLHLPKTNNFGNTLMSNLSSSKRLLATLESDTSTDCHPPTSPFAAQTINISSFSILAPLSSLSHPTPEKPPLTLDIPGPEEEEEEENQLGKTIYFLFIVIIDSFLFLVTPSHSITSLSVTPAKSPVLPNVMFQINQNILLFIDFTLFNFFILYLIIRN